MVAPTTFALVTWAASPIGSSPSTPMGAPGKVLASSGMGATLSASSAPRVTRSSLVLGDAEASSVPREVGTS